MKVKEHEWVPLTSAAMQLGMRYQAVLNLVLCRRLIGEKRTSRWMVEQASVDRLLRERRSSEAVPA